jgi:ribosomal protein S7
MPRKTTKALVRTVEPDRLYKSTAVAKLIYRIMLVGNSHLVECLVHCGLQIAG